MSTWHAVRIRGDLYRMVVGEARAQRRSVASQVDVLLSRALDRESNTSASSGGGSTSSESIPGESGRGAGVGRNKEIVEVDEPALSGVDPASASDRASGLPWTPSDDSPVPSDRRGQITVDEAIGRCPVCNDSLDDERRCVDPECSSHRAAS